MVVTFVFLLLTLPPPLDKKAWDILPQRSHSHHAFPIIFCLRWRVGRKERGRAELPSRPLLPPDWPYAVGQNSCLQYSGCWWNYHCGYECPTNLPTPICLVWALLLPPLLFSSGWPENNMPRAACGGGRKTKRKETCAHTRLCFPLPYPITIQFPMPCILPARKEGEGKEGQFSGWPRY